MDHTQNNGCSSIGKLSNCVTAQAQPRNAQADAAGRAARKGASPPLALTMSHIPPQAEVVRSRRSFASRSEVLSPRVAAVKVAVGGSLVRVTGGAGRPPASGGKRGRVATFSRSSRRRLLFLLQSLNRTRIAFLPLFLTLTYPAVWDDNSDIWKDDLEKLWKRIQRRYPYASMVWRLEPQKRGAPHFHILLFGVQFVDKEWLSAAWYEVVGSGDEKHLRFGSRVERVKSWRGVMSYASKYVAKLPDETIDFTYVGRWWGIKGGKHLPVDWFNGALSFPQFYFMRRVIRRFLRRAGVRSPVGRYAGATAFLPSEVSFRLLDYLVQEYLE